MVGAGECLVNPGFGEDQLAHAVVLETHHGVGVLLDGAQRLLRLLRTPPALEGKRQRRADQDQRVVLPRRFDDHRSSSRTGAAAQARAHDHQRHAVDHQADLLHGFLGGRVTQFRVSTRAQAACHVPAQLNFLGGDRAGQGLHVGVTGHEIHVDRAFHDQAVERVRAGPAHAYNLDPEVRVGRASADGSGSVQFVHGIRRW